jgi:hypothetical protein
MVREIFPSFIRPLEYVSHELPDEISGDFFSGCSPGGEEYSKEILNFCLRFVNDWLSGFRVHESRFPEMEPLNTPGYSFGPPKSVHSPRHASGFCE